MTIIDKREFQWLIESACVVKEGQLEIEATEKSDYFIDPATKKEALNMPFLYTRISGDFMIQAKVSMKLVEVYDGCGLLFFDTPHLWGKLCFEYTDIGSNAVVSVITDGVSDDANGQSIIGEFVWLQISRKGQLFAMHYSLDGKEYRMVRYFSRSYQKELKVGFFAQSPLGNGGTAFFESIAIKDEAPSDMRKGS